MRRYVPALTIGIPQGDYEGADMIYRRAIEISEKVLGEDHPDLAPSIADLAFVLLEQVREGVCGVCLYVYVGVLQLVCRSLPVTAAAAVGHDFVKPSEVAVSPVGLENVFKDLRETAHAQAADANRKHADERSVERFRAHNAG